MNKIRILNILLILCILSTISDSSFKEYLKNHLWNSLIDKSIVQNEELIVPYNIDTVLCHIKQLCGLVRQQSIALVTVGKQPTQTPKINYVVYDNWRKNNEQTSSCKAFSLVTKPRNLKQRKTFPPNVIVWAYIVVSKLFCKYQWTALFNS